MIKASQKVFDRFPEITRDVERLAQRATQAAAEEAAHVAKETGGDRGLTDIEVVPVSGDVAGYSAGIKGKWYYRFQSDGTLGKNPRAKRPGTKRSHAPGTGITPNRMFQKARAAGRRKLRAVLDRGI